MTLPSAAVRRFRSRLLFLARVRRMTPGTVLTLVSLSLIWLGVAIKIDPWVACILIGALLVLLTPVGAALRILLRGR